MATTTIDRTAAPLWLRLIARGLETAADGERADWITRLLCDPLGFPAAWYGTADFRTRTIRVVVAAGGLTGAVGQHWTVPSFARTPEGTAAMTGNTQVGAPDPTDPLLEHMLLPREVPDLRSRVTVPVRTGEDVAGVLSVYGSDLEQSPSTLALLAQLARDLVTPATSGQPAGFLTTVADAQIAPIVVLQADVDPDAAQQQAVRIVAVNAIAAAVLSGDRAGALGLRNTCLPTRYAADDVMRDLITLCHEGRSQTWTDHAVVDHLTGREERLDITALAAGGDMLVVTFRTVTERFLASRRAQDAARRDHLTNLGSRAVLLEQLEDVIASPRHSGTGVAVCVVGIDGLSRINEALSLAAGDEVLRMLGVRLVAEVEDARLVARLSGDEFAVVLREVPGPQGALSAAEHMRDHVTSPMRVLGQDLVPSVSIGVSYTAQPGDPEMLLHDAGLAVRRAKERGRGRIESADPQLAIDALDRHRLEQAMRHGLERDEFRAWFQPIVDLRSRLVRGHEALARWQSMEHAAAGPGRFVPIAEMAGLAPQIDLRMLEQALATLDRVPEEQFVSVNVSAPSLHSEEYLTAAATLLAQSGIDSTRVHLEITETALVADTTATVEAMEHLAAYGAQWYLDDFGTGFSSLAHLRDLPVRGLKLDMSFTQAVRDGDPTMIRLTQGVAGLALGLGLDTIAEGIDAETVAATLAGQGWAYGQGFLFGRAARIG